MSNYLEIDSKILEKNLLLQNNLADDPNEFEKFLQSRGNYSLENPPWKIVTPAPGLCIKTTDAKKNKVFINLCKLDDIPEPKEVTETELLELWNSEEVSDYRVPLSIQDPHDELDKSGKPTVVYDVAINTNFFKKVQENLVFRSFVIQVVLEGLENKYDLELKKEDFVILQNRKCLGELKAHRIRTSKGPYQPPRRLIEELPPSEKTSGSGDGKIRGNCTPNFRLFENKRTQSLFGEFHLPNMVTPKEINLDVGEDRIVLESRRGHCLVDVFVPTRIDARKTVALFNTSNRILTVVMPISVVTA